MTSLKPNMAINNINNNLTVSDIKSFRIPELNACIVVIENGKYKEQLTVNKKANEITLSSIANAVNNNPKVVEKHFSKFANIDPVASDISNKEFTKEGVFLSIPDGVKLNCPIHIINIVNSKKNLSVQYRNLIVVGKNSEVKIIESFHNIKSNGVDISTDTVTEIVCGENSNIDHYKIQNNCNDIVSRDVSTTQVY